MFNYGERCPLDRADDRYSGFITVLRRHYLDESMIHFKTFIAVAFAMLVQSAGAKDIQEGMQFAHHNWSLICDNARTCSAVGNRGLQDWLHYDATVLLSRKAGPGEPILAMTRFVSWDNTRQQVVRVLINGEDFGFLDGPDGNGDYQLSASQVQSLLPILVGRYSGIVFKNSDGREWPLSVDGAAAVLLKMDEVQGRIGTPGAVMRKGKRPEQGVLPPASVPVVNRAAIVPPKHDDFSQAFAAELRKELIAKPEPDLCKSLRWGRSFSTERLSKDKVLVSLECYYRNYGPGVAYWVANDAPPYDPQLVTMFGVSYDHRGEILARQDASTAGDCAVNERWTWDGVSFVQTSVLATGKCVAPYHVGTWEMPILVKRVVPGLGAQ